MAEKKMPRVEIEPDNGWHRVVIYSDIHPKGVAWSVSRERYEAEKDVAYIETILDIVIKDNK